VNTDPSLFDVAPAEVGHGDEGPATSGPIVVYTDGACSGNPGPGGWAWAVAPTGEPSGAGGERDTTNQRMELRAVLEALRTLATEGRRVVVMSDSTYVVNCFRDGWWRTWKRNGWRNSQRKPVANVDLWEPLVELATSNAVEFRWVKGHSGDPLNDLVDRLAVEAAGRL
jgi:ribonuclease HI